MIRRDLMLAGIGAAFASGAKAARLPIKKAVLGSMLPRELPDWKTKFEVGKAAGFTHIEMGTVDDAKEEAAIAKSSADSGSRMRRLAGHSLAWAICRTASLPSAQESKVMPAVARNTGRACTRIQASVITPRMPSEPITMRSGLGPAPDPGKRRDSHQPCGVHMRTDSTKSSMWVWLVA